MTVKLVLDNAVKARSKWNGQQVTVVAVMKNVFRSIAIINGGESEQTSLTLADAGATSEHDMLLCQVDSDVSEQVSVDQPVTVKATVHISELTGIGQSGFAIALDHCALAP